MTKILHLSGWLPTFGILSGKEGNASHHSAKLYKHHRISSCITNELTGQEHDVRASLSTADRWDGCTVCRRMRMVLIRAYSMWVMQGGRSWRSNDSIAKSLQRKIARARCFDPGLFSVASRWQIERFVPFVQVHPSRNTSTRQTPERVGVDRSIVRQKRFL